MEGRRDQLAVQRLLVAANLTSMATIDAVGQRVKSNDGSGDGVKSRVIRLCQTMTSQNVVGLVDRDYLGFALSEKVVDEVPLMDGNVWFTRGHSIENYIFDGDIIWQAILQLSVDVTDDLQAKLATIFETVLRQICALSYTAYTFNLLGHLKRAVGERRTAMFLEDGVIDVAVLLAELSSVDGGANALQQFFEDTWEIIGVSTVSDVQWLIHGHVGLQCVVEVLRRIFSVNIKEDNFFSMCFPLWLHRQKDAINEDALALLAERIEEMVRR